ncbi:hypothetical protein BpHYR1_010925 [Brachionus plicatilis]|uniref:VWFA domain-containing protein n=1 Tax=Brachionus plicatilis TaxID=10195 RepID=A0A3M7QVR6_BRAPC|nr:hypothetical protein BpHYR1_010925 [Brachionus plicatilis]
MKIFNLIILASFTKATDFTLDANAHVRCFPQSANVLFLIDSSTSSGANNFVDLINRVIPFILDEFNESLSKFLLSVVSYTQKLTEIMPLHESFDIDLVKAKITILQQDNQIPNHILALKKSATVFTDLVDVPNFCLWFTDGDFIENFKETINQADRLKSFCQIFIINIGSNNNNMKLMRLASAPNFVFDSSKLDEFLQKTRRIFISACQQSIHRKFSTKLIRFKHDTQEF